MDETTTIVSEDQQNSGDELRRQVTYIVLQTGQILSFFAYLLVGYCLLSSWKKLKKTLSLHAVTVLVIINFIQLTADISLALQYLKTGVVRPSVPVICNTWMFIDSFTYYLGLLLMAWTSFERHLLIFHSHLFNTSRVRLLFHYCPIAAICLYALIFYIYVDFLYPCTNTFDFSYAFCGLVCYMNLSNATVFGIEMMVHQVLPTFLITPLGGGLLVRTILSRQRLQRSIEWRKYRRMIVQLLSVSVVYLLFSMPFSLNPIAQLARTSSPLTFDVYLNVFSYWAYGICIFLPFVLAGSLPDTEVKLSKLFRLNRNVRVTPNSLTGTKLKQQNPCTYK